jgi:hypothetical protein
MQSCRRLCVRLARLRVGREIGGPLEHGMKREEGRIRGDDRVMECRERETGAEDGGANGLSGHGVRFQEG